MKKLVSLFLALVLILGIGSSLAENMGVQIIGGPAVEVEPVNLSDFKVGDTATIKGWGIIELTGAEIQDGLGSYNAGTHKVYYNTYYWSGSEAEYMVLYIDITNIATKSKLYLENVTVKVVYDDTYEYGGWSYQRNYNNPASDSEYKLSADKNKQNKRWAINKADNFAIDPMYQGHYLIGATLPNAVINGTGSLKLIFTMDDNEITYIYRK